ncbi:TenA family transcriptional regulator [Metallosphaera tengchongensis]|uniref:TenA family transcriptional regulator n=1 Tax=Metallosphaera tengchongensis TaxID=1532350 RepID=A0A6N0NVD3_9CREN|nr:TenA family transcriptional regulator [Metallosphaera tengchongensis]QKR00692.1 TenA family transcriptional regulator [Metallosphaera tengchongensis]
MLSEIRKELRDVNVRVLNHEFVKLAEEGKLPMERMELFYSQQWYIVNYDVRSLALMLSRAREPDELDFFFGVIQGDYQGLRILNVVARKDVKPIPSAVVYTHYMSWLANYANPGEQVLALVVNLPVWSENCRRLAKAFKGKLDTKFLELFAGVEVDEGLAERIISRYQGQYMEIARTIQAYELAFWDSLLQEKE